MKREKAARSGAGIRPGCTICASIRMLKSVMRPWCEPCGCARSGTRLNGLGAEDLPWRRISLTRKYQERTARWISVCCRAVS